MEDKSNPFQAPKASASSPPEENIKPIFSTPVESETPTERPPFWGIVCGVLKIVGILIPISILVINQALRIIFPNGLINF